MQQSPIRNANRVGASVYSHSGEFAPDYTDLRLTGRGLDFELTRSYCSSLAGRIGELGRGWSSSIAKRIERKGTEIFYHNGTGEVHKFANGKNGNYTSPTGFYGVLLQEEKQYLLHHRSGRRYRFEVPERGGRIVSIEDRNRNVIQLTYSDNRILIVDTLSRKIAISVINGLLQEVNDHAGRTWKYIYDKDARLIEGTQPATAAFPNGTSVKYSYDTNHRLISITDAKGQKYLVNSYDKLGRVVAQEHGNGVFKMEYYAIGEVKNGFPTYRTTCIRKNGSKLVLDHNGAGNVLSRTLYVRKESFATEDTVGMSVDDIPLTTRSVYSKNSELISRIYPAGNKTEWVYSENEKNPLNQGNLLQVTEIPSDGVESDQEKLVTKYGYEPKFQLITTLIDPRGNKTSYDYDAKGNLVATTYPSVTVHPVSSGTPRPRPLNKTKKDEYQYNSMGQVLRGKHIDGSVTEYHYYPIDDPIGTRGPNTAYSNPDNVCGYLARVVRDADGKKIKNEYAYDKYGNATTVLDGKGNPARLQYNAMGKIESVIGREPFKYKIHYEYDANYNEIESAQSFERFEYDETNQATTITSSILRELKEYDALNNLTRRQIVGDDKTITERLIRDADGDMIRQLQPLGNVTEYVYDERNLLIEKKSGVGTRETLSERFTYTLNGAVRTYTDGNGKTTTHHYDGFHRYKGFTNPVGTRKTLWFDEAGNVVRVEIEGDKGLITKESGVGHPGHVPLVEIKHHYDEWNRAYRIDRAWRNPSNGQILGKSNWNGEEGIVSTVLEYEENGLPGKVWTETNNVVSVQYDGVGRIVKMKDLAGEEGSFEYDENSNPTLIKYLGPEVHGTRFERVLRRRYDEMDRLEWQQENDEASERFAYNALGNVISHVGKTGIEIHHTDDSLGRRVGHAFTIVDALGNNKVQKIGRRFEYDDNYRLAAYTDAAGKRTMYRYDTLDRQVGVVFPDGNAASVEYDASGNIVRVVDQNKNEIKNRYDAFNRLVERQSHIKRGDKETIERFEYDGLSRMVAANASDSNLRRTYDSLSRVLTEQQGKHELRWEHDSAGNLTRLVYPGGEEVFKTYDIQNRVTAVEDKAGDTVATFSYRANDQIAKMFLGNVIEADFSYNLQERLESLEYRNTGEQKVIEGFRYQYDDTGKMTHEVQLSEGPAYGERFFYDNVNRATKAQYGVQNVFDPRSSFEQETSYEHFPEGSWKRRVDVDGQGRIIEEQVGSIDQLNKYQRFGSFSFEYDANGNCVSKGKSNPGYCLYTYDQANRLIKSECYTVQGMNVQLIQTIEYFYDALGRQVRKVVTDQSGTSTDYTYVWAGNILLEEYENGVLVRTYVYSIGSLPAQLTVHKGGRSDYYYTHNGRGLASGLVPKRDPNAFAEKYGYELTGASFMKEIKGVKVGIPSRQTAVSSAANSIISGEYLKDWANGSHSGSGGKHTVPEIAAVLNSSNGIAGRSGHYGGGGGGITNLGDQLLTMLGRGRHENGSTSASKLAGTPPGISHTYAPNRSFISILPLVLIPAIEAAFWAIEAALAIELVKALWEHPPVIGLAPEDVSVHRGGGKPESTPHTSVKTTTKGSIIITTVTTINKNGSTTVTTTTTDEDGNRTVETEYFPSPADPDPDEDDETDEEDYSDPDAAANVPIQFPSPQQVEAKLNQTMTPMNPNDGIGSPVNNYSLPKGPSQWDLIAHYGEEEVGGEHINILALTGGGITDTVEGWQPSYTPTAGPPKPGGEITPNTGRPFP